MCHNHGLVFRVLLIQIVLAAGAFGQDRYATIQDCAVTLVGEFDNVFQVSVRSSANLAVQEWIDLPGVGPFVISAPFINSSDDHGVVALNTTKQVTSVDELRLPILYKGTQELAMGGDLQIEITVHANRPRGSETIPFQMTDGQDDAACSSLPDVPNLSGRPLPGILGGLGTDEQFATLVDGHITLNGTFANLSGLEARSTGGYLSLHTVEIPDVGTAKLTLPFRNGAVVQDTPNGVVIGSLGASNHIDIDRSVVKTSIRYSETQEAAENDLTINIGQVAMAVSLPIGGVAGTADGTFSVEDGFVTLEGNFSELSGIEAFSARGFLSLAENLSAPFNSEDVVIVDETDGHSILIGVNTASGRVNLEGLTQTAIRYSASDEIAQNDLVVQLGIARQGTVPIQHADAIVPEPSTAWMGWLAILCLLQLRRRSIQRISTENRLLSSC